MHPVSWASCPSCCLSLGPSRGWRGRRKHRRGNCASCPHSVQEGSDERSRERTKRTSVTVRLHFSSFLLWEFACLFIIIVCMTILIIIKREDCFNFFFLILIGLHILLEFALLSSLLIDRMESISILSSLSFMHSHQFCLSSYLNNRQKEM